MKFRSFNLLFQRTMFQVLVQNQGQKFPMFFICSTGVLCLQSKPLNSNGSGTLYVNQLVHNRTERTKCQIKVKRPQCVEQLIAQKYNDSAKYSLSQKASILKSNFLNYAKFLKNTKIYLTTRFIIEYIFIRYSSHIIKVNTFFYKVRKT